MAADRTRPLLKTTNRVFEGFLFFSLSLCRETGREVSYVQINDPTCAEVESPLSANETYLTAVIHDLSTKLDCFLLSWRVFYQRK